MTIQPFDFPLSRKDQAQILLGAAHAVHEKLGRIPTEEDTSPEDFERYTVMRRRAALDLSGYRAFRALIGDRELPGNVVVRTKDHHSRPLRLDFQELGNYLFIVHATVGPEGVKVWGFCPLEWIASVELDSSHPFLGLDRFENDCVEVPTQFLLPVETLLENFEAIADGSAEFPFPEGTEKRMPRAAALASDEALTSDEEPFEVENISGDDGKVTKMFVPEGLSEAQIHKNLQACFKKYGSETDCVMTASGEFVSQEEFDKLSVKEQMGIELEDIPREVDDRFPENQMAAEGEEERADRVEVGFGQMAKNLAKTAGQAIKGGMAPKDIRDARWNTCKGCPFLTKDDRCSKCGCYMKAKVAIADADCPVGKWGSV